MEILETVSRVRSRRTSPANTADQAVRDRLLAGALHLFSRKGYAATTVREIVEAAGVTKPALYYYFENKEGIFQALMQEAWRRFDALLEETRQEGGTVRERILRLAERLYSLFLERIEIARIALSVHYGPFQGRPVFDIESSHQKIRSLIGDLVREGIRSGEFQKKKAGDITWAILGIIHMAVETQLWHPDQAIGGRGLGRILNLVFEGISAKERKGE